MLSFSKKDVGNRDIRKLDKVKKTSIASNNKILTNVSHPVSSWLEKYKPDSIKSIPVYNPKVVIFDDISLCIHYLYILEATISIFISSSYILLIDKVYSYQI